MDLLVHLRLSNDATGTAEERDALFDLDALVERQCGDEYDGNDIGEGEFLIHLIPKTEAEKLLAKVVALIPAAALRRGSYAVIRTAGRDEDTERVIPLAGEPAAPSNTKPRKPLSFGVVSGGDCAENRVLREHISDLWKRIREAPDRKDGSGALIVIWYLGGDISTPDELREKVKIEIRAEHVLGSTIEIPRVIAGSADPSQLARESLQRVFEKAESLVRRRKLGWDLTEIRSTIDGLGTDGNC